MGLDQFAGRSTPRRSDSRNTRLRLIEAVGDLVRTKGLEPRRLADVAEHAGVSVATAYRHFTSVDDVVRAHVVQLPERAAELFDRNQRLELTDADRFQRWNQAWVRACLDHGPSAVHLRSTAGFLERRAHGDPVVAFVCRHVEPLLSAFDGDVLPLLVVWNVVSDPREVLDLHVTLKWSGQRIARFITTTTLAARPSSR
ncbi:MAG: TetR/AcrR family transcriptional regulator [Ilumatobacteraceae bacterium]